MRGIRHFEHLEMTDERGEDPNKKATPGNEMSACVLSPEEQWDGTG